MEGGELNYLDRFRLAAAAAGTSPVLSADYLAALRQQEFIYNQPTLAAAAALRAQPPLSPFPFLPSHFSPTPADPYKSLFDSRTTPNSFWPPVVGSTSWHPLVKDAATPSPQPHSVPFLPLTTSTTSIYSKDKKVKTTSTFTPPPPPIESASNDSKIPVGIAIGRQRRAGRSKQDEATNSRQDLYRSTEELETASSSLSKERVDRKVRAKDRSPTPSVVNKDGSISPPNNNSADAIPLIPPPGFKISTDPINGQLFLVPEKCTAVRQNVVSASFLSAQSTLVISRHVTDSAVNTEVSTFVSRSTSPAITLRSQDAQTQTEELIAPNEDPDILLAARSLFMMARPYKSLDLLADVAERACSPHAQTAVDSRYNGVPLNLVEALPSTVPQPQSINNEGSLVEAMEVDCKLRMMEIQKVYKEKLRELNKLNKSGRVKDREPRSFNRPKKRTATGIKKTACNKPPPAKVDVVDNSTSPIRKFNTSAVGNITLLNKNTTPNKGNDTASPVLALSKKRTPSKAEKKVKPAEFENLSPSEPNNLSVAAITSAALKSKTSKRKLCDDNGELGSEGYVKRRLSEEDREAVKTPVKSQSQPNIKIPDQLVKPISNTGDSTKEIKKEASPSSSSSSSSEDSSSDTDSDSSSSSSDSSSSSEEDDEPLSLLVPRCVTPKPREVTIKAEELRDGLRVLFFTDGLFYEGRIKEIQAPDVYGVIVDRERGGKPHIMSQEETLHDAIFDIEPGSVRYLPIGRRVCTYWSQQFSCLYPGKVINNDISPKSHVQVEFDDGDSGKIPIDHIRLLPQNWPESKSKPNPLHVLRNRTRRRMSSSEALQEAIRASLSPSMQVSQKSKRTTKTNAEDTFTFKSEDEEKNDPNKILSKAAKKENVQTIKEESKDSNANHLPRDLNDSALNEDTNDQKNCAKESNEINKDSSEDIVKPNLTDNKQDSKKDNNCNKDKDKESTDEGKNTKESKSMTDCTESMKVEQSTVDETECSNNGDGLMKRRRLPSGGFSPRKLPSKRRQWKWEGKSLKKTAVKGRGRKEFYKCIIRGTETLSIGDCAVFLSPGRPLPYVGRIESLWENCWGSGQMMVKVKWFYHPEETKYAKKIAVLKGALFESKHEDENDVQTISHRCQVLSHSLFATQSEGRTRQNEHENNVFFYGGTYDPITTNISLEKDVINAYNLHI